MTHDDQESPTSSRTLVGLGGCHRPSWGIGRPVGGVSGRADQGLEAACGGGARMMKPKQRRTSGKDKISYDGQ
jgi:hypothetical protein